MVRRYIKVKAAREKGGLIHMDLNNAYKLLKKGNCGVAKELIYIDKYFMVRKQYGGFWQIKRIV